jgi:energy-coupling factor transport system ATP-binding protein
VICVENLCYTYPPILPAGNPLVALNNLSFEVAAEECLAVTGPNGCGKTTLCLAIAGLAPRLTGGKLSGRILVAQQDVQAAPIGALADRIGLVLQDPTGQLFNPTIEEEVAWGLENLGLPAGEIGERIEWALRAVGLGGLPRERPPQTLSGGQQKRLVLAATLALRPAVLLLDEPSSGLAPVGRAEMIAALHDLRKSQNLTILLAESDPDVIAQLADRVLVLDNGNLVREGSPQQIYLAPDIPLHHGMRPPSASQFAAEVNSKRGFNLTCLTFEQAIEQVRHYPLNTPPSQRSSPADLWPRPSDPAIELDHLTFAYTPSRPVLHDLSLIIPRGQFAVLSGDNGAGKTTLAKHLIGLLRPTSGRVLINGTDTTGQSVGQLARQVGFAFQNPEMQIFSPTIREEIAFGPRNLGMSGATLDEVVNKALDYFGLAHMADYPPAALSTSARRMVALASIAAMNTPILVLDEPTASLDALGQGRIMDWLSGHHRLGGTILLITHDMELAARYAERVLILKEGRLVCDGRPEQVFTQLEVLKAAGLEPPFAARFAGQLANPYLAADLTPQGAAQAWLECLL